MLRIHIDQESMTNIQKICLMFQKQKSLTAKALNNYDFLKER